MNISQLEAGDDHYMAYVGPPAQYDFMGATQFRLLSTLGLRAHHSLLDFGCGSLRAGRLFLAYLDEGRYFGVEPNRWLIEDAIKSQLGQDVIALKKPRFDHNSDFRTDLFDQRFDFIVAQSILSHTSLRATMTVLNNFRESLNPGGLIAVTFVEGNVDYNGSDDWVYPGCVTYRPGTIAGLVRKAGLSARRIPWFHPRQTWYILARQPSRLPTRAMMSHLSGAVLLDQEFAESWMRLSRIKRAVKRYVRR